MRKQRHRETPTRRGENGGVMYMGFKKSKRAVIVPSQTTIAAEASRGRADETPRESTPKARPRGNPRTPPIPRTRRRRDVWARSVSCSPGAPARSSAATSARSVFKTAPRGGMGRENRRGGGPIPIGAKLENRRRPPRFVRSRNVSWHEDSVLGARLVDNSGIRSRKLTSRFDRPGT
jgi:hypothetical protein